MENIDKFKKDNFVQEISQGINQSLNTNDFDEVYLVGGAVIDILEGRVPKDYDLIDYGNIQPLLNRLGYVYKYETTTAITFEKNGVVVQILKTSIDAFDYTISQAKLKLDDLELEIDKDAFKNKILIPVPYAFENKYGALASLHRMVHWKKKGYTLPDETYSSLLGVASRDSNTATLKTQS